MKQILLSVMTIAIVGILAVGATRAFFNDTEVSTGNTFTAGELDLKVDGKDTPAIAHVVFDNVVPAVQWQGTEYDHQWVLKNTGSVPGKVTYTIKNIKNIENGCNDPEVKAGDTTCGTGDDQGELGNQFKMLFQLNQAPYGYNQELYPLNSVLNVPFLAPAYHLNGGETKNVYVRSWFISSAQNNLAQGDGLEFDIEFKLEQDTP